MSDFYIQNGTDSVSFRALSMLDRALAQLQTPDSNFTPLSIE